MKIRDLQHLAATVSAATTEKRATPRTRTEPVCDVKLSSLATWLADLRSEASSSPDLRSEELRRAMEDIENGTLDEDLDAAVDALLLEL